MRLKLEGLNEIVKKAVGAERITETLRNEVSRVLGPAAMCTGGLEKVAEAANDRIDVLERTGKASSLSFRPAVLTKFVTNESAEVRKLAARMLPERFAARMAFDKDHSVRLAVARRLPVSSLKEMVKVFPNDDELRLIYKSAKLNEAGIPQPKVVDEPFDMYGEDRLGDAVKQSEGPELSDQWYKDKAFKFLQDYGGNIEYQWEETLVQRYISSVKATSGVEIDGHRLIKALRDLIEEKEDRVIERNPLKETLDFLKRQERQELLNECAMPAISLEIDPVRELLEAKLSNRDYIAKANVLFNVKEYKLPAAIRAHRLGEEFKREELVPGTGCLPHTSGFRALDERALDTYVKCWNDRQALQGEPLRLSWNNHPEADNKIGFQVELK